MTPSSGQMPHEGILMKQNVPSAMTANSAALARIRILRLGMVSAIRPVMPHSRMNGRTYAAVSMNMKAAPSK